MKVYVENKDKMTSYQWGYHEESKRYFVKLNFDLPSDTKLNVLSLSDYTKQVRKEVCEELCKMLTDRAELIKTGDVAEFMFTTYDLQESIKQIQGE